MKENKLGITIVLIITFLLLLSPWYIWYKEALRNRELLQEYNSLKNEIQDMNKLIDKIRMPRNFFYFIR